MSMSELAAYNFPRFREHLEAVSFFRAASPEALDALAQIGVALRYPAGAIIFTEGEESSGMFLVADGVVRISRLSLEGREYTLLLAEPGTTFNDVPALDGGPNPANAIAQTDVVVWRMTYTDLRKTVQTHPDLAWVLIESLAARTRVVVTQASDLAMRTVRGRLARLLLQAIAGRDDVEIERSLTQEELAARLGTVREMVSRTLRSMASDGIITFDRYRIVILDLERLTEEAQL